jgi:hypothetical protein
MPQDELWACSARLKGLHLSLDMPTDKDQDHYRLTAAPRWSKTPSGRSGFASLSVPTYAIWSVSEVTNAILGQFLGGDAKHIPAVASATLRHVLEGYAQGARS